MTLRLLKYAVALALLLAGPAFAQSTAEPVVDGYLTTSGCSYGQTTCFVQFGPTRAVTGNIGGFDSGPVIASATPNSSSHAAGSSVGGLFSVPLARLAGGSGIITNLTWMSAGGSTGALVIRIWNKTPANTTCTDQTAYVGSAVDDAFLITPPFSITPAAPASTTGDAKTYAAQTGLSWDYNNTAVGNATQNVYVCAVTVSTDTADESAKVTVMVSGPQN